tara:strand:+ start:147 stop:497 length:351 start_codon:yes stop_codon:yes gene_type:complete
MNFESSIKKWVSLDNHLKSLNNQIKEARIERNDIADNILRYIDTNELNNATVNISDGNLRFINTRQSAPLTLRHVESCLHKCISNEDQVNLIMNCIKETRDIKETSDIKRTYNKKK